MFAVGEITYRERDEEPGLLIYIKPTYFFETAPVDVRSYGSINQDFPHESTMDQFFSESQFESYRRLGFFLASHLDRGSVSRKSKPRTYAKLGDFFARVARTAKARAKKASAPVVEAATAAAVGVPAVKVAKKAAPETRAA